MKRRAIWTKALSIVMCIFMLTLSLSAFAAGTQVMITGKVNVRSGPGTSYTKLGQLAKDQVVNSLGTTGGWTQIEYQDGVAYVSSVYVSAVGTTAGSSTGSAVGQAQATGNVNVRSGPGTGYSKLGQLKRGETISYTAVSGGWYEVEYQDGVAYVSGDYLKTVSGGGTGSTASSGSKMEATGNVNVRSGPGTKHSKLGQLKRGQEIDNLGTSNGWVKTTYNGKTAYVSGDYLIPVLTTTVTTTTNTTTTTTTNTDTSNKIYAIRSTAVRQSASNTARAVGYLDNGDSVVLLEEAGYWYKVQLGGSTGYVYAYDMQKTNPADTTAMSTVNAYRTVLYDSVPYYTSASTTNRIGYLTKNLSVYVQTANTTWSKVLVNGQSVYVQTINLSGTATGTTDADGMTAVNASRTTTYDSTPYYSYPIESSNYRVSYLVKGQSVYVQAADTTWARCTVSGKSVYIPLTYLGGSIVTSGDGMVAVNEYRTCVQSYAPTYSERVASSTYQLGNLLLNQQIFVQAVDSTWARFTLSNGTIAYVQLAHLDKSTSDLGPTQYGMTAVHEIRYAVADRVVCYTAPNGKSDGELSKGESVVLLYANAEWGQIRVTITGTTTTKTVYTKLSNLTLTR